jgi:hypothetical protein
MTSSELETASFRLVAYCLNQLRYRVSPIFIGKGILINYALRHEDVWGRKVQLYRSWPRH